MDKALLRKAAVMLADEAKAMRESCMVGKKEWACADCYGPECPQRKRQEDMAITAGKLYDAAETCP